MVRSILLVAAAVVVVVGAGMAWAQPTPPVMPKIKQLPLPPAVKLPPPPVTPADVPNRPLTADEAVALALRHQPSLIAAQAGVNGAQGHVQAEQSFLKPSVSVNADVTNVTSNTGGGFGVGGATASSYVAAATARQLIYDFNHTRDLVRQSMAQEKSAQATLTKAQADLALQVKLAFYTYLQDLRLVRTAQIDVRNRLGHFALAEARLQTGLGLPSDVVTAQTGYAQAVYNLAVARNNATSARITLARTIGIDPRTPIEAANVSESKPAAEDLNKLTDEGLRLRPEMRQAEANIRAAEFGISVARTTNKPTISGSATFNNFGGQLPPTNRSLSIAVGVEWKPIDSGYTKGLIKQSEADLTAARAQLETERLAVISDVAQAYLNVKSSEQKLGAAEAEVANAKEALRLAQGRYRAGVAIFIEVLDAETDLDTANINAVNAQAALDQARASLAHAIGQPFESSTTPTPAGAIPPPVTSLAPTQPIPQSALPGGSVQAAPPQK